KTHHLHHLQPPSGQTNHHSFISHFSSPSHSSQLLTVLTIAVHRSHKCYLCLPFSV
ncbi:hypothetical protein HAX54_040300, partial [Datura stramonium]|nr:hypothetical protein [Datura stramonium]